MLVFQDFAFLKLWFLSRYVENFGLLRKKDCKDRKCVLQNKIGFQNFLKIYSQNHAEGIRN
jgi:hypothetical protein